MRLCANQIGENMRFWESLKIAAGFEKKGIVPTGLVVDKVTAGSGPLKMEWKAVSEVTNDEIRIAKLLSDSFIEKRIMERRYEDEPANYVLESLKSLYLILDERCKTVSRQQTVITKEILT
jgi:hypothetical protein